MTESEFSRISWPEEFFIEYKNGERQLFVSAEGVIWDSGCDEPDENENRANISCSWQKKSPTQQRYRKIQVWVDEILSIQTISGSVIWGNNV